MKLKEQIYNDNKNIILATSVVAALLIIKSINIQIYCLRLAVI